MAYLLQIPMMAGFIRYALKQFFVGATGARACIVFVVMDAVPFGVAQLELPYFAAEVLLRLERLGVREAAKVLA